MSFMSTLFGGGESKQSSNSGFSLLPSQIQDAYKNFASQLNQQIPNAGTAFTPMGQTADETTAFNQMRQGYAPTEQSLNRDVSMLMNPFNNSVIDNINRQANSDFSVLKQNASQAGQFGSNRQMLGASDIENQRQSNIGSLLQSNYNNALSSIFDKIIPQRQQDTQNLLGIGNMQRNLQMQQNTAPITGLQQLGQALSVLPQSGGSQSTGSASQNNGIFKSISLTG